MKWPWVVAALQVAGGVVGLHHDVRQADAPSVTSFRRRGMGSVAVLDNYLYVVGGEVSQYIDDEEDSPNPSRPVNKTLSIPLSQSWDNSTITFRTVDSDYEPPIADGFGLWADPKSKSLYQWGGAGPYQDTTGAENIALQVFSIDEKGGGSWSSQSVPDNIKRTVRGGATACGGLGFWLGGYISKESDARTEDENWEPAPGLVTYNFGTGSWTNESTEGLTDNRSWQTGQIICVPTFGDEGLVVALGGESTTLVDAGDQNGVLLEFGSVAFWDIRTRKWHSQVTRGAHPEVRRYFCAVGVQGPNGTFEIVTYGGDNGQGILDDVWVLSLPGFQWFKADVTGPPRHDHACALAGERQMIVSGGFDDQRWDDDDPWEQGLGVFDLSALEWSNSYDANAEPYDAPGVVREWYDGGGLNSVTWTDDQVKSFFVNTTSSSAPDRPSSTGSSSSSSSSSSNNVGAIAGGVVGGVVFLVILGVLAFCIRRRRRAKQSPASSQPMLADNNYHYQYQSQHPPPMVEHTPQEYHEADSSVPTELDSQTTAGQHGYRQAELPG